MDSCRLRKLEPGLAATYSRPSAFSTSTMKSEPGRSISVALSGWGAPAGAGAAGCACAALAIELPRAAAPLTATPLRNVRRSVSLRPRVDHPAVDWDRAEA